MATKTPNLGLIKPARGEYEDTWDTPMNKNSDALDASIGDIQVEVEAARGSKASLNERIAGVIKADGTIQDIPEIATARSSAIYGISTALDARIELGDREVFDARENAATLVASLAQGSNDFDHNTIVSAPTGFLSFTGANVKVDGSVTPVVANINGYRQVVRTLKQTTLSGVAGTYYIYLQRNSGGEIYLDRTGVGQNAGQTGTEAGVQNKFSDSTQNFLTSGVKSGDILEITTVGNVAGQYIVSSVMDANNLLVYGDFAAGLASLNYKLTNPLAPSLSFSATAHAKRWAEVSGKIYIGRAVFDGTNVTSTMTYAVKGRFEQFVSISLVVGDFSQTVSHSIGYFPRKIQFFGSQANDYTSSLEPLSVTEKTESVFTPGTGGGTLVSGVLSRSVVVKMDDTTVSIKNATNGIYYKDFDGVTHTSGYLFIVAER